jgi:hypothetical protein
VFGFGLKFREGWNRRSAVSRLQWRGNIPDPLRLQKGGGALEHPRNDGGRETHLRPEGHILHEIDGVILADALR